SVTGELAINFRTAFLRVLELFDNGNARPFAHDEAVTVAIERTGRALRLVVATAKRSHRGKSGETEFDDGSFGTASQKNIGVAKLNYPPRFTDRIVRRRTRSDDAHVRSAQTEFHRDHAAGHIADQHRNGERRRSGGSFVHQNAELVLECL